MSVACRVATAATILIAAAGGGMAEPLARPTQYVIISFDGAHDLAQWERSRALAKKTGASFTYFLSCVFLLSPQTKNLYRPPHKASGASNVGFAATGEEVAARLSQIWTARGEGHEIASHGCGHFDGKGWSAADWGKEFDAFATTLRDAYAINGLDGEPAGWRSFAAQDIRGFRAPYLSTAAGLYEALAAHGFAYDASGVSRSPALPQAEDGVMRFALPLIPEGPSARPVIAMDYNLFVRHSGGFEKADTDGVFEERTLAAFTAAFEKQYAGERVPVQLGFHFTLMNGAAYWRALERFAVETCGKPDVACVSYRDYLESRPDEEGHTGSIDG
jgi:peptidoglycan/xylan/chitin deacetylase (PgdA/CDA1 family)